MTLRLTIPLAAALCAAVSIPAAIAQDSAAEAQPAPSPGEIVDSAPADEWIEIAASDLMVMDLAPDRDGKPRRVVIQLVQAPYSKGWVGNIRKLAAAKFWDGTSVNRVQDNYVVQWGDATEQKPLPDGLVEVPESEYAYTFDITSSDEQTAYQLGELGDDIYALATGLDSGFPYAADMEQGWLVHCYGMVGVGRGYSPDTGTGAELYTVIGHAPRHLDRNIALVGRVIEGIEHLSSLPRGSGPLGFYAEDETPVPIVSVRIATDLPESERPRFAYLSTEGATFARYADARANRRDPFFIQPAGGADICNIPVPVRAYPWVKAAE